MLGSLNRGSKNPSLNIAIDARVLSSSYNGNTRYVISLLQVFAQRSIPHHVFLYSPKRLTLSFKIPEHWKIRSGKTAGSRHNTPFAQVFFPLWAIMDGIDVFWSPIHQFPILLPPRIRKVITIHDLLWKRFPATMNMRARFLDGLLTPTSIYMANQVISVSEFTQKEIISQYPSMKHKIHVIHEASSLGPGKTSPPRLLPIPYFLCVGSNHPRKNLKRLLDAYIQYRNISPTPLNLVLAGGFNPSIKFSILDYIKHNALTPWVTLFQNIDDLTLCSLYAHAYSLVIPSIYEGFCLPLVEAMQWGLPLITSNNSATAEVAGNAALTFDPFSTESITSALLSVSEDKILHRRLAQNSKIRGTQFNWEEAASITLSIITDGAVAD